MKKYNSFLGAFFSGDNGQGGYNAGYRQSALAKLYDSSAAPEEQQAAQAGLMRVDPDSAIKWQQSRDEQNKAMVADSAKLLVSLGKDNPLAAQAWQTRIKPQLVKMYGEQAATLPDIPDDNIMAYAQQLAGGGQAKARSAHILEDGTIAYMDEYGKLVRTGEKASNNFRPLIGANGEVTGFDPRGNTATPSMLGTPGADQSTQQNPPPEQKDTDPMAPHIARINADGEALRRYGLPQDQVNAWMDNQFTEAQKSVQQNGVVIGQQGTPQAPPVRQPVPQAPMGGGQARVSVKPPEPKQASWNAPVVETRGGQQVRVRYGTQDGQPIEQVIGPAEQAQPPRKPWSTSGLKDYNKALEDVSVAGSLNTMMDDMVSLFNDPEFELGPIQNKRYELMNWSGNSTPQSIAYSKLKANFEKMRNDSLRLNAGVQTDGDAQRAWNEIMQNMNDKDLVIARLQDIKRYNEIAATAKGLKVENYEAEFGKPGESRRPPSGGNQGGGQGKPQPGEVRKGYRFKGGDPANPQSWEKV